MRELCHSCASNTVVGERGPSREPTGVGRWSGRRIRHGVFAVLATLRAWLGSHDPFAVTLGVMPQVAMTKGPRGYLQPDRECDAHVDGQWCAGTFLLSTHEGFSVGRTWHSNLGWQQVRFQVVASGEAAT